MATSISSLLSSGVSEESTSTITQPSTLISSSLRDSMLDAVVESIAINSGKGSANYITQTIMSKHDRFGSAQIQMNADNVGLTFFTRPRLNMTTASIRQDRRLVMMDTVDPTSLMFAMRCNLDSVWAKSTAIAPIAALSPWFNDTDPFNIPVGNMLTGIQGWPDFSVETKTTESGYFAEDMTMVRGSDWGRKTYDLTCSFRDHQGGYLMAYFYLWLIAMTLQMDGSIVAYSDDREANRLNYTCSIYRFTMTPDMSRITKWAKATGCYPVSVPIGATFDINPGDSYVHGAGQFSIPFKANNISYMDPIHLQAFNTLVQRYAGSNVASEDNRVKSSNIAANNFTGVPYIDLTNGTNELYWLAEAEELVDPTIAIISSLQSSITSALASLTSTTGTANSTTGIITDPTGIAVNGVPI